MAAAVTKTVGDLINKSMKIIGELAPGEVIDSNDQADALESLQDLVQELSSDQIFVPFFTEKTFTMTANTGSYTIGESGAADVAGVRPEQIAEAFYRDDGANDTLIKVIGISSYAQIPAKYTTNYISGTPEFCWYNPTVPDATLYLYPYPDSSSAELHILYEANIAEPVSASADLLTYYIPRNYHNALQWMLAVEICPLFGHEPTTLMAARAGSGYERIIGLNAARRAQPASFEIPSGNTGQSRLTTIYNS